LHFAAKAGRADNIKLLLENQPKTARLRDRDKLTPMAYACKIGKPETILAFLDSKIIKVGQGQGPDRMAPLSWAAATGNYDLCLNLIVNYKARVLSKDKYKRFPIHHAIINGHAKVASLLLQNGSDWNAVDSSGNSCLHYAAAGGYFQCVDLLMKHGAEINAENMWKVTPINIAMLMNHVGMVKRLLQEEGVDVNGKDDKGRTLLALTCIDLSDEKMVDFADYLMSKGADPNIPDINGNTVLHALATYTTDQPWRRHYPYN
jgi:ankyrin repeat protein